MRIAYVDCASNVVDAFEAFSHKAEEAQANTSVARATAPDFLKLPICTKKLLSGSDLAVVFLTIDSEDWQAMALVHEKMVDVELATDKYVFFCIVSSDEYNSNEQLEALIEQRYDTLLELIVNVFNSPAAVSQVIGNAEQSQAIEALSGAMGMFSAPTQTEEGHGELPPGPGGEEDDAHSLF